MSLKYRVKDLAADFAMTPKEISQIMEKFFEKPKSNTQIMTEEELNVVFDYITQNNQISSL
jgi:translation initiation factor IF-2